MKEKRKIQEEQFNPEEHKKVARTWTHVRMKSDLDFKPLPPTFVQFSNQFKDGILSIDRTKTRDGTTLKRCLCRKIPCDVGCLTWPNLSLTVMAENGQQAAIHSNWVDPVQFLSPEEIESEKNETEIVTEEAALLLEESAFIEEDDTFVEELQPQETVVENFLKAPSENERMDFIVVHLDAKGELMICPLDEFVRDDFVFDYAAGRYLFGDFEGKFREPTFFDEDRKKGFIIVMEGKIKQICSMADALMFGLGVFFKEKISEEMRQTNVIVSKLLESVAERI